MPQTDVWYLPVSWLDYVLIGIVLVSALISLIRGFAREALSLAGWVLAFWVGLSYATALSDSFLKAYVSPPALSVALGFTLLFAAAIALTTLVNYLIGQLIKKTGLSATDRAVGVLFGIARGCIVVAVLVFLGNLTAVRQERWWTESKLVKPVHTAALWLSETLTPDSPDKKTSG